jgi:hypothetical protein
MGRLIICIDFDGVIHKYSNGWQNGEIYDDIVPGFFPWALVAREHFCIVVYSSRSASQAGIRAMKDWFLKQWMAFTSSPEGSQVEVPLAWINSPNGSTEFSLFDFSAAKPPAWLTIDDRALCFNGNWADPNFSVQTMRNFRPWNKPL